MNSSKQNKSNAASLMPKLLATQPNALQETLAETVLDEFIKLKQMIHSLMGWD